MSLYPISDFFGVHLSDFLCFQEMKNSLLFITSGNRSMIQVEGGFNMSKIAVFCIRAQGHTNPTIEVVRELVQRGNEVWYYSYLQYKEKIEEAGAKFIACDDYDVDEKEYAGGEMKITRDFAQAIKKMVDITIALDETLTKDMQEFQPDCIMTDSMATWGKATAKKMNIPFICSTATFAYNKYSCRIMKRSMWDVLKSAMAMPSVSRDIKRLQDKGYPFENLLSIIANDNMTNTIVYTSSEFQPCAETFSTRYFFVGPMIPQTNVEKRESTRKQIYISLGMVNKSMIRFFKNCILALKDKEYDVIISVGQLIDVKDLGEIPPNFTVEKQVDQIRVLQNTDVFISHCGMNSVNESLYYEVPMVLYPQTLEQGGVASRVAEVGAGIYLEKNTPKAIEKAVEMVLADVKYKGNAKIISYGFKVSGGSKEAADAVEWVANKAKRK